LLAPASYAVVLADARPDAWHAHACYAVVLADARPAASLVMASYAVVLADAPPSEGGANEKKNERVMKTKALQ
jgi:hypothetical protein